MSQIQHWDLQVWNWDVPIFRFGKQWQLAAAASAPSMEVSSTFWNILKQNPPCLVFAFLGPFHRFSYICWLFLGCFAFLRIRGVLGVMLKDRWLILVEGRVTDLVRNTTYYYKRNNHYFVSRCGARTAWQPATRSGKPTWSSTAPGRHRSSTWWCRWSWWWSRWWFKVMLKIMEIFLVITLIIQARAVANVKEEPLGIALSKVLMMRMVMIIEMMMMMTAMMMRMMIMGVKKVYLLEQFTHQCFALKILPSCGEEGRIKNNIACTCMLQLIYKVFDKMWVPWFVLKFPWHQVDQSQEWKLAVLGDCAGWQVDISSLLQFWQHCDCEQHCCPCHHLHCRHLCLTMILRWILWWVRRGRRWLSLSLALNPGDFSYLVSNSDCNGNVLKNQSNVVIKEEGGGPLGV